MFGFATIVAASTLCGCASNYSSRASGQTSEDKAVSEAVLKKLVWDPTYGYSHVSVSTADGTTLLTGTAHSWQAIDHAANAAMFVQGVQQVQNQIIEVK